MRNSRSAGPELASATPAEARSRPPIVRAWLPYEFAIVGMLVFAYDRIRGLADTREAAALHHGFQLLHLQESFGFAFELSANQWLASHPALAEMSSLYYQFAHLTVALVVLAACWVLRPEAYRAARNSLVLINLIGLAVFWAYPVAPPRLLPGAEFVDITRLAGFASSSSAAPNQYAAMPSLHTAWAIWAAVVAMVLLGNGRWRLLPLLHPAVTVVVICATGNHYVIDAVAGAAVAGLALAAVRQPVGWWGTTRADEADHRSWRELTARRVARSCAVGGGLPGLFGADDEAARPADM